MRKALNSSHLSSFCIFCVLSLGLLILPAPSAYGLALGITDTSDFSNGSSWDGMNWDYVYETGAGTSVAIDGWHLITASHYSLGAGTTFTVGSDTFEITGSSVPPVDTGESVPPDLRIIEVQNNTNPGIPLPGSYELYNGTFTQNQEVILVGTGHTGFDHGTSYSDDTSSPRLKRWGTNKIERFSNGPNTTGRKIVDGGDADTLADWSTMTFRMDYDANDTDYEVGLSDHDSGSGIFVLDGGNWKLAGLGLYRTPTTVSTRFNKNYFASIPDYDDWMLGFLPEFLLGDANRDGVVSAGDYAAVQTYFGNVGGPGLLGDANGDGVVSAGDYASVQANFGNTAASSSAVSLVPEPTTISLLCMGSVYVLRRKRK